jgi:hypothetical protein
MGFATLHGLIEKIYINLCKEVKNDVQHLLKKLIFDPLEDLGIYQTWVNTVDGDS